MPISKELLDILCCPATKTPVVMLGEDKLAKLNDLIAKHEVAQADGKKVEKPMQEALITEDGKTIFRVEDEIPIMLIDEGIPTEPLGEL